MIMREVRKWSKRVLIGDGEREREMEIEGKGEKERRGEGDWLYRGVYIDVKL